MIDGLLIVIGAIAGALGGSVLHSLAVRLPAHLPLSARPACQRCHEPLPTWSLLPFIPIRCEHCNERTNWYKPATEISAVAIVLLSLVIHGVNLRGVAVGVFGLILLLILRIDWQHHLIFTVTIVPGVVLAFAFAALESPRELGSAALAAFGAGILFALFYALAVLIYRTRALGSGDILLAFLIGAMARVELVVAAILAGMILAALGGLFLIAIGKRTRRDYIPYGAYLCLGAMIVLLLPS